MDTFIMQRRQVTDDPPDDPPDASGSADDLPDEATHLLASDRSRIRQKTEPQPVLERVNTEEAQERFLRQRCQSWNLKLNCLEERPRVESAALGTFQPAVRFLQGEEEDAKLIKYSDDVGTFKALTHFSGTVLESGALWRTCAVYWAIAVIAGVISCVFQSHIKKAGQALPDFSEGFETMANYFTGLLGIMTSMFVVTLFGRWWKIRVEGIGGLWGAIDDIIMILSVHMPHKNDRPYKERILRLGLLSHRLVYAQAQGLESREHLEKLVHVGLVTPEELDILVQETSKPQLIWVWIGQIIHQLADEGKIQCKDYMLPKLDKLCVKARGSIGGIYAYLDTQVPFAYVHLLVLSIIFSNCLIALRCGLAIGLCYGGGKAHQVDSAISVLVHMCHLSVIPFFYHAFVHIGLGLANPVGAGYLSLPSYSFHVWMRNENMSFVRVGENTPASLLDV